MIYLFYGEDNFSIDRAISSIKDRVKEAEVFNIKNETIVELTNMLSTDSFFSEKRIFLLNNYLSQIDEKKDIEKLLKILDNTPSDTTVIITEEKEPKGKLGSFLRDRAKIKSFGSPKEKDLISFIKKRAEEEGSEIAPLAAERLASFVGPNFWQLDEEIKKLSLYKKDDPGDTGIQVADIDLLVRANFESNIFELLDAIATKNTGKAIGLINLFLESGENEIYILTMIARQFRNIAMAKFENNITEGTLAKTAGLHPFVAKKSIQQARNFDKEEIIDIYSRLTTADFALKSGRNPKTVLQGLAI